MESHIEPYEDSTELLSDPAGLKARAEAEGYLFLKGYCLRNLCVKSAAKSSRFWIATDFSISSPILRRAMSSHF